MHTKMFIEYSTRPQLSLHAWDESTDTITLEYRLRDYPIVQKWVDKVQLADSLYDIDDRNRFYGFGSLQEQRDRALVDINLCITMINLHKPVINRYLKDVHDQDTLNYLHHIFEIFHGLLDKQVGEFWSGSPERVRQALSNLNIAIHRCESVARGAEPRHVVTWFGLPKTDRLSDSDYQHFTQIWNLGTVFLNYVEIGKTMSDLAEDDDRYIHTDAFQPFRHYSADFVVRFFDQTELQAEEKTAKILNYYNQHQATFGAWRPEYTLGSLPVADLVTPFNPAAIALHQSVKSVYFE